MKRVALVLAIVFACGVLNATMAQTVVNQGTIGNCSWVLTGDSVLTISGSGDMVDYEAEKEAPWYEHRYAVKTIVVGNAVTSIGNRAFSHCVNMTSVVIGNSVATIGKSAFYHCRNLQSVTIPESVTSIGSLAFVLCSNLTEANVPESVTVNESAFQGCKNLQKK